MANPNAPVTADGRRIPFLNDPANTTEAFLPLGTGDISLGGGRDPAAAAGVSQWGPGTSGAHLQHRVADTFKPFDLTAVTTEQLIWDPAASKKFRLLGIHLKADVETKLALLDGTGGATIFRIGAPDSAPVTIDLGPFGILSTVANANLYVTSSASAAITGTVWGCEE